MISIRPYESGDLRTMLGLVSELWPNGRHGIGYAFMAQRLPFDDWEARLCFDGGTFVGWAWSTGWRSPRGLSYELRPGYEDLFDELLDWARPEVTTVKAGDERTAEALRRRGFVHDPGAPWIRWNVRPLDEVDEPALPPGYRSSTMAEYADFGSRASAHRSAFTRPGWTSRFSEEVYAAVRHEAPWRADLDCVVIDADGRVAAFALGWLDEPNRIGELEPVGVRAEDQRRGLGRAISLFALERLRAAGAETALVGSRGDDGYPGPRALYESIGFRESWRDLVFSRPPA
ncbi:MAG: GNAT family N-acetyltransferase [Gaiellaceae bacterium]